jgi:hypothetical protein
MLKEFAFGLILTISLIESVLIQYGPDASGIAAAQTAFLPNNNRRQSGAWNIPSATADSPVVMSQPGNARIETRQALQATTIYSPTKLSDHNENAETNQLAASEGTAWQKTVSPEIPETSASRYVSNTGSDANDGLSWRTAKHTIYGALVSLPGGGTNTSGSGTVYVGPASSANPTVGAGIWLMGPNDPKYASPPAGWLKCNCTVNIVGIANATAGPNGHKPRVHISGGSGADRNHPGIWLSALNGSNYFANLAFSYPGRGVVIGECSNNTRTGTCSTTTVTLDNLTASLNTAIGSNGPCTDVTGSSFWIWMRDYGCAGMNRNATEGYLADNAAAILLDNSVGTGGEGLIYITDANLSNGGIKNKWGINGGGIYVYNAIQEGAGIYPLAPTVWFTGWCGACDAILNNIQSADGVFTTVIENDGRPGGGGPTVFNSSGILGPATVINPDVFGSQTASPLKLGESGFFNNYVVGETDVARRISELVPARFTNKASTHTASWTFPLGSKGVTFKQGANDPFGGTEAAKISFNTSALQGVQMGPCTSAYTPSAGDWIVQGVWVKGWPPASINFPTPNCYGYPVPTFSASYANKALVSDAGEWTFWWNAFKVSGGSATYLAANGSFNDAITPSLYGPVLYIIPSGTLSDNEVLEFASSMNSVDSSCGVGQICNVAGHPVVVSSYGTLLNCSSIASPAKCDSAPAGSFVLDVGATTARVNTTAVTANSQILIIEDSSLGTKLGVACNKTSGRTYMITDRDPGRSFAVSSSFAPRDHPACLSFQLLN